jgi:hypothetical protein
MGTQEKGLLARVDKALSRSGLLLIEFLSENLCCGGRRIAAKLPRGWQSLQTFLFFIEIQTN